MTDITRITEADIDAAVLIDDLDEAVRTLQDKAGITDGGVASMCFSDEWPNLNAEGRKIEIGNWLAHEELYAGDEEGR